MIGEFFANMQPPPQTVSAAEVKAQDLERPASRAIGTARAANGVELAVEIGGVVKEINFKANQQVRQGDVLVQLDDSVERADLHRRPGERQARRKATFERAKTLAIARLRHRRPPTTRPWRALATARSRSRRLQAVIDQKALKAPFSGVVGIARIDLGQYLQPGTVVATLPGPRRP